MQNAFSGEETAVTTRFLPGRMERRRQNQNNYKSRNPPGKDRTAEIHIEHKLDRWRRALQNVNSHICWVSQICQVIGTSISFPVTVDHSKLVHQAEIMQNTVHDIAQRMTWFNQLRLGKSDSRITAEIPLEGVTFTYVMGKTDLPSDYGP